MYSLRCLLAFLLVSCANEAGVQTRYDAVRKASTASGICSIHHVPLQRAIAYGYSHLDLGTLDLDEAALTVWPKYPNIIDPYAERTRSSDYHERQVEYYCPICQKRFDEEVKRWRAIHKNI